MDQTHAISTRPNSNPSNTNTNSRSTNSSTSPKDQNGTNPTSPSSTPAYPGTEGTPSSAAGAGGTLQPGVGNTAESTARSFPAGWFVGGLLIGGVIGFVAGSMMRRRGAPMGDRNDLRRAS